MAKERKKYLQEKILSRMKEIIEDSDSSLEELEEFSAILNNLLVDTDLIKLQEKIDDK